MDALLDWAMGPLFWTALVVMVLGLARQLGLTLFEAGRAYRRAGDKAMPTGQIARATARWLVPLGQIRHRLPYSLTTLALHVGVILVPVLLAGHVALIAAAVGLSWPTLPAGVATFLTILTILAAAAVVVQRATARASRALSRFQDYALPVAIGVVFGAGLLVAHPAWSPFGRDATLLVHVLGGDLLLLAAPFTKLSHMILLPFAQLVSELAWHFPPDAGSRVAVALGKEDERI